MRAEPSACVFCGSPGTSKEHVFAQWIAEEFRDGAPFTLSNPRGRSKISTRTIGVTTRAACRQCNNGWMSRCEQEARPLIRAIIRGAPVTWTRDEQLAIARWSLKTALMLDRSRRKPWATPPEHCTFLLEAEQPPGSVQISLARYFPIDGEKPLDIGAAVTLLADVDSRFPRDLGAYRIVYNIGQAVFQVVGHSGVEARGFGVSHVAWGTLEGERVLRPFNDVFRTVWPQSGETFEWPPADGPLNTKSLRALGPNL